MSAVCKVRLPDDRCEWLRSLFPSSSSSPKHKKPQLSSPLPQQQQQQIALLFGVVSQDEKCFKIRVVSAVPCTQLILDDLENQKHHRRRDGDEEGPSSSPSWWRTTETGAAIQDAQKLFPAGVQVCGCCCIGAGGSTSKIVQESEALVQSLLSNNDKSNSFLQINIDSSDSSWPALKLDATTAFVTTTNTTTTTTTTNNKTNNKKQNVSFTYAAANIVAAPPPTDDDNDDDEFSLTDWEIFDTNAAQSTVRRTLESVVLLQLADNATTTTTVSESSAAAAAAAGSNSSCCDVIDQCRRRSNNSDKSKKSHHHKKLCFVHHPGSSQSSSSSFEQNNNPLIKGKRTLNTRVHAVTFSSDSSSNSMIQAVRSLWIQYVRNRLEEEDECIRVKSAEAAAQQKNQKQSAVAAPKEARWHATKNSAEVMIRVDPECSAAALRKLAMSIAGAELLLPSEAGAATTAATANNNNNKDSSSSAQKNNKTESQKQGGLLPPWVMSALILLVVVVVLSQVLSYVTKGSKKDKL